MAELLLKVGEGSGYEDGDILCVFSERRILQCHTEIVCHPRWGERDGRLLVHGTLVEDYQVASHRFRFERDGAFLRRIDLETNEEVVFGQKPVKVDGRLMYIDVEAFFARRLKSPRNRIFGVEGAEVFYGRPRAPDMATLDTVWQRIEAETTLRKADHSRWPLTEHERKVFLPLSYEALDDVGAAALVKPLYEDEANGIVAKDKNGDEIKRAHRIDYAAKLTAQEVEAARDKTRALDLRGSKIMRAADRSAKSLAAALERG